MNALQIALITMVLSINSFLMGQGSIQLAEADMVVTEDGDLRIQPVQHASMILEWGGQVIYVDPHGGIDYYQGQTPPTLILITDVHQDHYDLKTIEAIGGKEVDIVAPAAVAAMMPSEYHEYITELANGMEIEWEGIEIQAIPMYNLPEADDAFHVKGRGNGYVLNLGGVRLYISGDTEDTPEMRGLENIDIAFLSMNLPYTMNVEQAASAVGDFQPSVVYPYHYRNGDGKQGPVSEFAKMVNREGQTEVRLKDWYPSKDGEKTTE